MCACPCVWVGVLRPCRYLLQSSSITPLVLAVNGPALLHLAAAKNNVPCVAILIDAGVDQDCLDVVGDTPVCTAAKHGSVSALKFLLKNGGSVESDTYLLTNPLHYAVKAQSIECVRVLLDHARSRGAKALYKVCVRVVCVCVCARARVCVFACVCSPVPCGGAVAGGEHARDARGRVC